jgi:hypothetical protein
MSFIYEIFNHPSSPDWFVAAGTFFLAIATVVLHFVGDSSTRLMKKKINYDFQKRAYYFLNKVLVSSGMKSNISESNSNIFMDEFIEKFYADILDNRIFLNRSNDRRLKQYIVLSTEFAKAWDTGRDEEISKHIKPIVCEMMSLATAIGDDKAVCKLKNEFPHYVVKKGCWRNK